MHNFITAGLISFDEIIIEDYKIKSFGGSVIYSSIQAKKLNIEPLIVSLVGEEEFDMLKKFLENFNIPLNEIKKYKGKTLSFKNYYNEKRKQYVENFKEFKISLDKFNSEILHLGPILNEIDLNEFKKYRKNFKIISLDLQGFCRKVENNKILYVSPSLENIEEIDVIKMDFEELLLINKDFEEAVKIIHDKKVKYILITLGYKGSFLYYDNNLFYIPPFKPKKVLDPTGAGDVYLTSFVISLYLEKDPVYSSLFASCASSFVVEDFGTNSIATYEEILKRFEEQNLRARKINFNEAKNIIVC